MPLRLQDAGRAQSLPARGAWIEINSLKFLSLLQQSLPARGAWIEISVPRLTNAVPRRSPHGERGLKSRLRKSQRSGLSRSPHGERGLKCPCKAISRIMEMSLPARGAWIEINRWASRFCAAHVAPRTGSVD